MWGKIRNLLFADPRLCGATRSPRWPALRRLWLADHPRCAACGSSKDVEVHHITPVHVRPDLELHWGNLISLCGGERNCHLSIGHGWLWRGWNPSIVTDAAMFRKRVKESKRLSEDRPL